MIFSRNNRMFFVALGFVAFFICGFFLSIAVARAESLLVFAAASLKETLEETSKSFKAEAGIEVKFSFAASSALAKQIEAGAPADVFASADLKWMDYLNEKKLVRSETRKNLIGNRLVIIAPQVSARSSLDLTEDNFAKALGDGKLATGEVNSVPAGIYAKSALQNLNLWKLVEPKLAQADNVRGALAFVARNEAPLGIVYETDAKVEPQVKIIARFPSESHAPIIYPFAVTAQSKNPEADRFLNYLSSPSAKAIFEKAGFIVLAQ
ncbi:MAG: molybdate ABC transporter substrate-binding protein [Hyphomicrobiales bacterium]